MALPNIYTIGYEATTVEDLIASLKAAGVLRLVDIRESPYSRRQEFSKDELSAALGRHGIAYSHIRALGNPPLGREAARAGHKSAFREIFNAHLDGPDGQTGLEAALSAAARERICLLCLEKAPAHCHRSMVAERMSAMSGQEIVHLRVETKRPHPAQTAFDF